MGCKPSVLLGHTKWVADHEASNKTKTNPDFGLGFFMSKRLDKCCRLVYTNSVVNREVIRKCCNHIVKSEKGRVGLLI